MDFQAIFDNFRSTVTDHYFDMRGRVGRAQFWYFVLAFVVGALVAGILGAVIFVPVAALYNLAMLFPITGMGARRLQDIGRDNKLAWVFLVIAFVSQVTDLLAGASYHALGLWPLVFLGPQAALLHLALFVASVVLIYFWCQPGNAGDNAYGSPPPTFDPSVRVSSSP